MHIKTEESVQEWIRCVKDVDYNLKQIKETLGDKKVAYKLKIRMHNDYKSLSTAVFAVISKDRSPIGEIAVTSIIAYNERDKAYPTANTLISSFAVKPPLNHPHTAMQNHKYSCSAKSPT